MVTIVSEGTLRTEDLLSAFASELTRLAGSHPRYEDLLLAAEVVDPESEDAGWVLSELQDALDECAPAGTYFGAHEGDGALFGFWPLEGYEE